MTPEDLSPSERLFIAAEERTRGELRKSIASLSERLDNFASALFSLDARMAAMTQSMDRLIAAHSKTAETQAAQQRDLHQLAARVTRIENKLGLDQQ